MSSSNVPPIVEKQEILMDDHKLASDKEKVEMANRNVPSTVEEQEIIGTATSEMENRVELFNKYKEGELNLGDNSCIDCCVSEHWQVNNMIGHILAYGRRGL